MIQESHIDCALKELFDNLTFTPEPSGLYDPLRYMIQIGGKRIRPRLCLTTYSLYKDSFNEEILIPAQEEFILGIDQKNREIMFSLPEGLVEL